MSVAELLRWEEAWNVVNIVISLVTGVYLLLYALHHKNAKRNFRFLSGIIVIGTGLFRVLLLMNVWDETVYLKWNRPTVGLIYLIIFLSTYIDWEYGWGGKRGHNNNS